MRSMRRASKRARLSFLMCGGSDSSRRPPAPEYRGAKLHFVVVLAAVQVVEVRTVVDAKDNGFAVQHECVVWIRRAASTIQG
jgi:hypothetical protein